MKILAPKDYTMSAKAIARCDGKEAHKTLRTAIPAAENVARNNQKEINVYRCPVCNFYHLTSKKAG